jgi:hypothetical protein
VHKSGGGGAEFLDRNLLFRAEPIFLFVTVLLAAGLVEFTGTLSDLVLKFDVLWITCYGRWLFLRGTYARGKNGVNYPRLVQRRAYTALVP